MTCLRPQREEGGIFMGLRFSTITVVLPFLFTIGREKSCYGFVVDTVTDGNTGMSRKAFKIRANE